MSAIRRFAAVTLVTIGLVEGCGDDLGRAPYTWDSGPVTRLPDAGPDRDARETSTGDGTADTRGETNQLDGGADASVEPDPLVDGSVSWDADASLDADAILDAKSDSDAARDGGSIDPLRAALRAKSPTCLPCAEVNCPSEFMGCSNISGTLDAGRDASATTRSQLCVDTLQCLMDTECEAVDTTTCFCGYSRRDICWVPDVASGECKTKIEASFETTDPRRILDDLATPGLETGGGWSFLLARCLRDNACTSCFRRTVPDASTDRDDAGKPDVSLDVNPPPIDAPADLNSTVPDVQAEAEASAPPIDAGADADSAPNLDASEASSPPSDADIDAETSTSDAD